MTFIRFVPILNSGRVPTARSVHLTRSLSSNPKQLLETFVDTVKNANQHPAQVIALYAQPHLEKIGGKTQLFGTLRTATSTDYHTGFIVDKKPQAEINSCTTVALTNN